MANNKLAGVQRWLVANTPAAVAGHGGHMATFTVACALWRMLNDEADVWALLRLYNATKCDPPWSEKELRHKLVSAQKATTEERRAGRRRASRGSHKPRGSSIAEIRAALAAPPKRYATATSAHPVRPSHSLPDGVVDSTDRATNKRRTHMKAKTVVQGSTDRGASPPTSRQADHRAKTTGVAENGGAS